MGTVAHTSLKLLKGVGTNSLNIKGLVPGAGLEPARTLPGPRDFKSRVSTNSTIRAAILGAIYFSNTLLYSVKCEGLSSREAFLLLHDSLN